MNREETQPRCPNQVRLLTQAADGEMELQMQSRQFQTRDVAQLHILEVMPATGVPGVQFGGTRLWDANTGKPCGPPFEYEREVKSVAFSPTEPKFLVASADRTKVFLSDLPTPKEGSAEQLRVWVEVLTAMALDDNGVFRGLTAEEWEERKGRLKQSFPEGMW
jgi:hypothetical protein